MEQDHKELLIGLIGSTYGDLKQLDASIIGTSSTLNRRSDEVKNELAKVINTIPQQPRPAPSYNPPVNIVAPPPPPSTVNLPFVAPVAPAPVEIKQPDNDQLELNFDRKVRYEDIENKLIDMEVKLDKCIAIIETVLREITNSPKPKKKVSGSLDGSNL